MAYYVVPKDNLIPVDGQGDFRRREDISNLSANQKIVFVESNADRMRWHNRERNRLSDGYYLPVAWADSLPAIVDHFIHQAKDDATMVAFTASAEHGHNDRQTRLRPGRYLARFYPNLPETDRQRWAEIAVKPAELQIATSADDIETIYRHAIGFQSCMGPDKHTRFTVHPTRAYGDSDLAVAYLGPMKGATARCIIWPDKKRFTRVYGLSAPLIAVLEAAGYVSSSNLIGARLRAIPCDNGYLMPYLDCNSSSASLDGGYFILGRGDFSTRETCGYVTDEEQGTCDHCEDRYAVDDLTDGLCESCLNERCICERCNNAFFDDDGHSYCRSCEDDRSYCEVCESSTWDATFEVIRVTASGRHRHLTACEECADNHEDSRFTCQHCEDTCHEWRYDVAVQIARRAAGTNQVVCDDCADAVTRCHSCHEYSPNDAMIDSCPNCGIAARCPDTLPLPLEEVTLA